MPLALLLASCQPPPDERHHMPKASAARGLEAIERAGCGACHLIPGLDWPEGRLGPSLQGFAGQGMIAMPAMPLSEGESRDVAAYLYTLELR